MKKDFFRFYSRTEHLRRSQWYNYFFFRTFFSMKNIVFPKKVVFLQACFERGTIFIAQFLRRTTTSNEIYEQNQISNEATSERRRLHHRIFGAVVGLSENMAGLRFFVPKFAPFSQMKLEKLLTINNDKYEKLKIYISAHCAFKHGWNEGNSPRH